MLITERLVHNTLWSGHQNKVAAQIKESKFDSSLLLFYLQESKVQELNSLPDVLGATFVRL